MNLRIIFIKKVYVNKFCARTKMSKSLEVKAFGHCVILLIVYEKILEQIRFLTHDVHLHTWPAG